MRGSRPVILALLSSLTLAGCGVHGLVPSSALAASSGKYHAASLHAGNSLFSDHHLVVTMAPGATPPIPGVKIQTTLTGQQIHELPPTVTLAEAMSKYQTAPGVTSIERLELFPVENDVNVTPVATPFPVVEAPTPQLDTNDPLFYQQWSLQVANVPHAWQVSRGRPEVMVAALDTGVDFTHPDLQGQIIDGPDFGEGKSSSLDIDEHGTHVAGIIAAQANNGIGGAGVAPGCKVLAIKIFEAYSEGGRYKGNFYNAFSLAKAIQYAVTQGGAKIINISAGVADEPVLDNMFAFARGKGAIICVSAGNNGNNVYTGEPKTLDGVIVAHATTAADQLAPFSNYGSTLAISAPGEGIVSTVPTYPNPYTGEVPGKGGYDMLSGTSMASPFVAGVAALVVSALMDQMEARLANQYNQDVELTPQDVPGTVVEDLLRSNCDDLGHAGRDEVFGCGRIDAGKALDACTDGTWVDRAVQGYLKANHG